MLHNVFAPDQCSSDPPSHRETNWTVSLLFFFSRRSIPLLPCSGVAERHHFISPLKFSSSFSRAAHRQLPS
ncbi:unnamed protein product [Lota lota]